MPPQPVSGGHSWETKQTWNGLITREPFLKQRPDDSRGIAGRESTRRDRAGHAGPGADDAAGPDRHAAQDDDPGGQPGALLQDDRLRLHGAPPDPVVIGVQEYALVADLAAAADPDLPG